jgi:hypothetical protein
LILPGHSWFGIGLQQRPPRGKQRWHVRFVNSCKNIGVCFARPAAWVLQECSPPCCLLLLWPVCCATAGCFPPDVPIQLSGWFASFSTCFTAARCLVVVGALDQGITQRGSRAGDVVLKRRTSNRDRTGYDLE